MTEMMQPANTGRKLLTYGAITSHPDGAITYDALSDGALLCRITVHEAANPPVLEFEYPDGLQDDDEIRPSVAVIISVEHGVGVCPACGKQVLHSPEEGTRIHSSCRYRFAYLRPKSATEKYLPNGWRRAATGAEP